MRHTTHNKVLAPHWKIWARAPLSALTKRKMQHTHKNLNKSGTFTAKWQCSVYLLTPAGALAKVKLVELVLCSNNRPKHQTGEDFEINMFLMNQTVTWSFFWWWIKTMIMVINNSLDIGITFIYLNPVVVWYLCVFFTYNKCINRGCISRCCGS